MVNPKQPVGKEVPRFLNRMLGMKLADQAMLCALKLNSTASYQGFARSYRSIPYLWTLLEMSQSCLLLDA